MKDFPKWLQKVFYKCNLMVTLQKFQGYNLWDDFMPETTWKCQRKTLWPWLQQKHEFLNVTVSLGEPHTYPKNKKCTNSPSANPGMYYLWEETFLESPWIFLCKTTSLLHSHRKCRNYSRSLPWLYEKRKVAQFPFFLNSTHIFLLTNSQNVQLNRFDTRML